MDLTEVKEYAELVGISEDQILAILISATSPPQAAAVRQSWRGSKRFGFTAPATHELWGLLEESQFSCSVCSSSVRLTFDHINDDSRDHRLENLRVLCFDCNRGRSAKASVNKGLNVRVYRAFNRLIAEKGRFPTAREVCESAGLTALGPYSYLIKWLKFLRAREELVPANASPRRMVEPPTVDEIRQQMEEA